LRASRVEAGLTQTDLAKVLGLTGSTVSRIEAGLRDPSFPTLRKWIEALGRHGGTDLFGIDQGAGRRHRMARRRSGEAPGGGAICA
jgi:transcriptional regulator with XRE-family HTH domain